MPKTNPENRCQQINSHGRQCRSLRAADQPSLCSYHARNVALDRHQSGGPAHPTLAADLLGPVQDFRSAASINHVLGKLLVLLNTERITPRNAAVTAYICQLLLQSLPEVKDELYDVHNGPLYDSPEYMKAIKQIVKAVPLVHPAKSVSVPREVLPIHPAESETAGPMLAGVSRATS